jgi:hypothetical protein
MICHPFTPIQGGNKTIASGSTTANVEIGTKGNLVKITNASDVVAFFRLGASDVAATTADLPILAGETAYIAKNYDQTHIAAISSASGKTVYAIPGFAG